MKKLSNILWGVLLIIGGVLFALNEFDITDVNLFFDGWWTLFIIIPCGVGLFTEKEKFGNAIGVIAGVLLLLCCQEILSFKLLYKLIIPVIIVLFGIKLIWRGTYGAKIGKEITRLNGENRNTAKHYAFFSGYDYKCGNEIFDGATLTAVFGGMEFDLSNAVFEKNCVIHATAVFGGIDIFVPKNVNIKVNSTSIFGGVSNKTDSSKDAFTIYITGLCLFGGVDIKYND